VLNVEFLILNLFGTRVPLAIVPTTGAAGALMNLIGCVRFLVAGPRMMNASHGSTESRPTVSVLPSVEAFGLHARVWLLGLIMIGAGAWIGLNLAELK
jgi:hypothetical protein